MVITEWRTRMKTPIIELSKLFNNLAPSGDNSMGSSEKKVTNRKRQDTLSNFTKRKLNLDRRAANSDRRVADDPNYNGPARRNTIDRRMNLKDRREKG